MKIFKKILVVILFLFLYSLFFNFIYYGLVILFAIPADSGFYAEAVAHPGGFLLSSLICGKLFKGRYDSTLRKWCTGFTVIFSILLAFAFLSFFSPPEQSNHAVFQMVQYLLMIGAIQLSKNKILDAPEWQEPAPAEQNQEPKTKDSDF